jgi:Ser/Thr protein kinase RdoA (MazF antagonist)
MHGWLATLTTQAFPPGGSLRVPRPIGISDDLHMVLLEYAHGDDLRHWINETRPLELAAGWLARFHEMSPLESLKVRSPGHEIEKALNWLKEVSQHVPESLRARLDKAQVCLANVLATPPAVELRPIHRDFYYANVLADGQHVWAIDLDQLRIGDPALDVAHFTTHLEILAYRQTGSFTAYAEPAQLFLAMYRSQRPSSGIEARLPIYAAYTFLKLAATEAARARDGWREECTAFAERACDSLSDLAR